MSDVFFKPKQDTDINEMEIIINERSAYDGFSDFITSCLYIKKLVISFRYSWLPIETVIKI